MRLLCSISSLFHDWSRWDVTAQEPLLERSLHDPKQETRVVGRVLYQRRQCNVCGYTQIRKEKAA